MIPELDACGFLPIGVHDCDLPELLERFGGFQETDRRPQLGVTLRNLLAEIRSCAVFTHVIIDGSFTTAKPDPEDVDLILVLPPTFDFAEDLPAMVHVLLEPRQARRRWRFDIFAAPDASLALEKYIAKFTEIKGVPGRSKGMLRVSA